MLFAPADETSPRVDLSSPETSFRVYLYRQHACPFCDDAELELAALGDRLRPVVFHVTASPDPDKALVRQGLDGTPEAVPRSSFAGGFPVAVFVAEQPRRPPFVMIRAVGLVAIQRVVEDVLNAVAVPVVDRPA